MPHLTFVIPHPLVQEEAARRLKEKVDLLRESYGSQITDFQQQWNDSVLSFSFKTLGIAIKGSMAVGPSAVDFDAELPWLAMPFRGTIESKVREEVGAVLA